MEARGRVNRQYIIAYPSSASPKGNSSKLKVLPTPASFESSIRAIHNLFAILALYCTLDNHLESLVHPFLFPSICALSINPSQVVLGTLVLLSFHSLAPVRSTPYGYLFCTLLRSPRICPSHTHTHSHLAITTHPTRLSSRLGSPSLVIFVVVQLPSPPLLRDSI